MSPHSHEWWVHYDGEDLPYIRCGCGEGRLITDAETDEAFAQRWSSASGRVAHPLPAPDPGMTT